MSQPPESARGASAGISTITGFSLFSRNKYERRSEIELITLAVKSCGGITVTGKITGDKTGIIVVGGNESLPDLPPEAPPPVGLELAGLQSVLTLKSELAQESPFTQLKLI